MDDQQFVLPDDPVFFTETALGLVAVAGSLVMGVNYGSGQDSSLERLMRILNIANERVYQGKFSQNHATLLVTFVKKPSDYEPLFELERVFTL